MKTSPYPLSTTDRPANMLPGTAPSGQRIGPTATPALSATSCRGKPDRRPRSLPPFSGRPHPAGKRPEPATRQGAHFCRPCPAGRRLRHGIEQTGRPPRPFPNHRPFPGQETRSPHTRKIRRDSQGAALPATRSRRKTGTGKGEAARPANKTGPKTKPNRP